ncbi:MAG: methyltransferase domain-containing protein [Bacteroidota bacterium]
MESKLNAAYWSQRYQNNETGWDVGSPSTPLKDYIDQIENKNIKILIPGCGNAYEAQYLFENGFNHVFVIDLSPIPLQNLKERVPDFPENQLLKGDFFELADQFDLILEQTMFCAVEPCLRMDYSRKASELLVEGGKLVGVLFNREFEGGPPFGGTKEEYLGYFSTHFHNVYLEPCYNSIKPRQNSELFMICEK